MIKKELEIINKLGLHARAATKLANTATRFKSEINVDYSGKSINAKSIMSLMLLAAAKGSKITVTTEGEDEQDAMSELESLISDYFGEGE